jgi:hypothetical protein
MEITTHDIGYIELYPTYADEIIIEEEPNLHWLDTWDSSVQDIATRIWQEYVGDESLLTEEGYAELDNLVFLEVKL